MISSRHFTLFFIGLSFLCVLAIFLAIVFGAVDIPVIEVFHSLLGSSDKAQTDLIIASIRLPRALLAATTGALLALCGAVTQGLFRNPLADPSLIGVTAGASLGGSLVIFLGLGSSIDLGFVGFPIVALNLSIISFGAFIGGALAVILVFRMATNEMGTSVPVLLLAGIAITALSSSFTQLLEYFSDDSTLRRISLWRMGGLDGANTARVLLSSITLILSFTYLYRQAPALNALLLGESEARHLGINVDQLKRGLILAVAAGVGISVALAGAIAFVGLIVPHFVRLLLGPDHRYLIPASALAGAILLCVADIFSRLVIAPSELPVGLVTALIGAPVFISLLRHRREYGF